MIVCPSCHTRYRDRLPTPETTRTAHCSQCDELFPVSGATRNYILRNLTDAVATAGLAANSVSPHGLAQGEALGSPGPARPVALLELLIAMAPAGLGAAVAYYLAVHRQLLDPVPWACLGAAAGLLLGWGCVRWIRREG